MLNSVVETGRNSDEDEVYSGDVSEDEEDPQTKGRRRSSLMRETLGEMRKGMNRKTFKKGKNERNTLSSHEMCVGGARTRARVRRSRSCRA